MKKNFNKEIWYTLEKYNYYVANIVEFYIVRTDHLNNRIVIKGDMNNFKEEILKFNNTYHPDERLDSNKDNDKNNFNYDGWITFEDNSFIKRKRIYENYYDCDGVEEWTYVKFPRISDMIEQHCV